ncbi:MAG: hypothetical protein DSY60_02175 [Persephonella sp.]|nr:MAG: hypothetical protein DSY60_02175 [Persephonella sp.]
MVKKEEEKYKLKELGDKYLKKTFRDERYILEGMKIDKNLSDDTELTKEEFLKIVEEFKKKKLEV